MHSIHYAGMLFYCPWLDNIGQCALVYKSLYVYVAVGHAYMYLPQGYMKERTFITDTMQSEFHKRLAQSIDFIVQ